MAQEFYSDIAINGQMAFGSKQSYTLPAQGTRMRLFTMADNTLCRVYLETSENAYHQPIILDIFYRAQSTNQKPQIVRSESYEWHTHSNDVIFTSDGAGSPGASTHVYAEKVAHGTGRTLNIRKIEVFDGTVTILDGSTTDTNGGTDESVISSFTELNLGDNNKLNIGNSDDLQIYHDGSNSHISEVGNGDLIVTGNSNLTFKDGSGDETFKIHSSGNSSFYGDLNQTNVGTSRTVSLSSGSNIRGSNHLFIQGDASYVHIKSNGNNVYIDGTAHYFRNVAANANYLVLDSTRALFSGEVEATTLDINGNANISGTLDLGGDLKLDLNDNIRFGGQLAITKENNGELKLYGGTNSTDGGFELFTWTGSAYSSAFTLKNNQTAAFAGDVAVGGFSDSGTSSLSIRAGGEHDTRLGLFESSENYGFSFNYDGGDNRFYIKRHNDSAGGTAVLSFQRYDDTAYFAGEVEATSLDINGNADISGNLSGVDTLTASLLQLPAADDITFSNTANDQYKMTNTETRINTMPFPLDFHDLLVFGTRYTTTQEISTDGTNFSSMTLESGVFDLRTDETVRVIDGSLSTEEQATRYTFTNVAYNGAQFVKICFTYSSPSPDVVVTIETSNDGFSSNSTQRHQSTFTGASATTGYFYIPYTGADTHLRITLDKGNNTDNKNVNVSSIQLLTRRHGDQGNGPEYSVPYDYDYDRNIQLYGNLDLVDGKVLRIGSSDDLQIYHDGSNSYIKEAGNGSLVVESSDLFLRTNGTENAVVCAANSSVTLYYDNVAKLATKSDGVDITGELQADSLDIDGAGTITGTLLLDSANYNEHLKIRRGDYGYDTIVTGTRIDYSPTSSTDTFKFLANVQTTGALTSTSLDINGNADISGTLDVGPINVGAGTSTFTHVQNAGSKIELKNNRQDAGNVEIYRIGAYNSATEVGGIHFYRGGGGNSGNTRIFAKKNNASSLEQVVQFGTNDALTTSFAGQVNIPDSTELRFGGATDGDFAFQHNGTHNLIKSHTGDLKLINYQDAGDTLFFSDDGSTGIAEYFRLDGGTNLNVFSKNVVIGGDTPDDVGGVGILSVDVGSSQTVGLRLQNGGDDGIYFRRIDSGGKYQIQTTSGNGNSGNLSLQSYGGSVGIGIVAPVSNFHVFQDDTDTGTGSGITVENDGSGDALVQYLLTGVRRWVTGIDHSDGDKFKIASSATLGSDDVLTLDTSSNATFAGQINSGRLNITDPAVPIMFTESGNTGTGKYWRQVLDGGDIRFDVDTTSTNGDGSFSSYIAALQLNADGHTDINGALDVGGNALFGGDVNVGDDLNIAGDQLTFTNDAASAYIRAADALFIESDFDNDDGSSKPIYFRTNGTEMARMEATVATFAGNVTLLNTKTIKFENSVGNAVEAMTFNSSNELVICNGNSANGSILFKDGGVAGFTNLTIDGLNNKLIVAGEVEASSLDINGNADISGKLVLPQTSTTIGTANLANASFLVGSTSLGIGIDNNEIVANGNTLNISTISGNDIKFRTGATEVLTLDASQNATFAGKLNVNQSADDQGLQINGYDDRSGSNVTLRVNSAGHTTLSQTTANGSGYLFLTAENYLQLSAGNLVYTQNQFRIYDAGSLTFGNEGDSSMRHDGSNFAFQNTTGNVTFTQNLTDGDIIFKADNGSGTATTYFYLDGGGVLTRFDKRLRASDGVKIEAGSSGDLQIYHESDDSYINNTLGHLVIQNDSANKDIIFKADNGSGMATFFQLDGSELKTTVSQTMEFQDNVKLAIGNSEDLIIDHNATNSRITNYTGNLRIINASDGNDITLECDNGSGGVTTYLTLDGSAGLTVSNVNMKWNDGVSAVFGTGGDSLVRHTGANMEITNTAGDLKLNCSGDDVIIQAADDVDILVQGGETAAKFGGNGGVDLYHNNVSKFGTNSSGTITKFSATSSTDGDHAGDLVYFGTTNVTPGKIYYYTSAGQWELADADAESTAKGLLAVGLGETSADGMLIRGMVTLDTDPGTRADTLFLSTTAGAATSTAPSGAGDIVRVIGYCLDSSNGQVYFNPDGAFVEVANS